MTTNMKKTTDAMTPGLNIAEDASHWWGFAAMPDNLEYPCNGEDNPLTLICQFHHGEGMVYVFADLEYFFGDLDADGGHIGEWDKNLYKVLYSPTRENLHVHEIRFSDGTSGVPEPEEMDAPQKRGETSSVLQPAVCFHDEIEQEYPGYQVLLQLDENDGIDLRFYDCGNLFFLIKPEDLAAKRFDKTICVLYSY